MNPLRQLLPARVRSLLWHHPPGFRDWDEPDYRAADFLYPTLNEYLDGGRLLDLGCGSGTTARALPPGSFTHYHGVDVSRAAIAAAIECAGGDPRQTFSVSTIEQFTPTRLYDVILFRELLYRIAVEKVPPLVTRYARALTPHGVFIARIRDRDRYRPWIETVRETAHVLEEAYSCAGPDVLLIFEVDTLDA